MGFIRERACVENVPGLQRTSRYRQCRLHFLGAENPAPSCNTVRLLRCLPSFAAVWVISRPGVVFLVETHRVFFGLFSGVGWSCVVVVVSHSGRNSMLLLHWVCIFPSLSSGVCLIFYLFSTPLHHGNDVGLHRKSFLMCAQAFVYIFYFLSFPTPLHGNTVGFPHYSDVGLVI